MIFKNKRQNKFTQISNDVLVDENLSYKAKGILAYLLSRPADWNIYENEIEKHSKDGIDSVRTGIKELIDNGYVVRQKSRVKGMFDGYEYAVSDNKDDLKDIDRIGFSVNGKTENGFSHITNTDITNKDITNKEDIRKDIKCSSDVSEELNYYKNLSEFLKEAKAYYQAESNGYRILKTFYTVFKKLKGYNHYKISKQQWDDVIIGVEYLDDIETLDNWIKVENIVKYYLTIEREKNYYTIQDFFSRNTLIYILSKNKYISGEEVFDSNGDFATE